jgi:hypothetical protein
MRLKSPDLNGATPGPFCRPFRAGASSKINQGLKSLAESLRPFGTEIPGSSRLGERLPLLSPRGTDNCQTVNRERRTPNGEPANLEAVTGVDGIDLFAGCGDLLAKFFVVCFGFLIGEERLSRIPRFPIFIEKG